MSDERLMSFSAALLALKNGERVARQGWNGNGMFIYLNKGSSPIMGELGLAQTPWYPHGSTIDDVDVSLFEYGDTGTVTRLPSINMRSATGAIVTGWLASQTDMLAEDWMIVSERT